MKIEGHAFVVTGGASGLGAATTRAILAKGGKVAIFDLARQEELSKPLIEDGALFVAVDVMDEDSVVAAVAKTEEAFGQIDGCVLCAGTGLPALTVNRKGEPASMAGFDFIIKLNLYGTFSVASKCAAVMFKNSDKRDVDAEKGVIIMVASVAAFDGQDGQASYAASKAAVAGMTLPMARDLSRHGIRVNTIAPGTFATPLTGGLTVGRGKRVGDNLKNAQLFPKGRFGVPDEFASLACELIGNKMMNGETIRIDGGIRMPKL